MPNVALIVGSLSAMLAVMLGAFGAHGLKSRLTEDMLAVYQTGVQYHLYHSLGLMLAGVVAWQLPGSVWVTWSACMMLAGIVLFSGSLYTLAFTNIRRMGMITPIGGVAFIVSWLLMVIAVLRDG